MMKKLMFLGICVVCALSSACAPTDGGGGVADQADAGGIWKEVAGSTKKTSAMGGEIVAAVEGREVAAVIKWRAYNAATDASVTTWYGDMGSPPPAYVVDSLMLAIDGKGVSIAKSQYRNLCSKWMNQSFANPLNLHQQGNTLRLVVYTGDGGEGWAAVFVFDPKAGKMLSHRVEDGVMISNQVVQ